MPPSLAGVPLTASRDGAFLPVLVQPRAARDRLVGLHDDRLKVQLTAPPIDGKANAALVRFLAKALGVPRSAVRVAKGLTSRRKLVEIEGVTVAELVGLLEAALR